MVQKGLRTQCNDEEDCLLRSAPAGNVHAEYGAEGLAMGSLLSVKDPKAQGLFRERV